MKSTYLIIIGLYFWTSFLFAQQSKEQQTHVIVALDMRSGIQDFWTGEVRNANKDLIPLYINSLLNEEGVEKGVMSRGNYCLNQQSSRIDDYVKKCFVMKPFADKRDIALLWNSVQNTRFSGVYYSVTSIAKPYSFLAFQAKADDNNYVNRTYLILISDFKYNGNNDYYDELKHVEGFTVAKRSEIIKTVEKVAHNYFCRWIAEKTLDGGYMDLYEFVPLQQYFSLEAIADFPHEVTAKRTKSGYRVNFGLSHSYDNPNYELMKTEVQLLNYDIITLNGYESFELDLPREQNSPDINLSLKSWVRLKDGVYNRTVLHPDGSELQGAKGLNREIHVIFESDTKILGFIPLSQVLYKASFWTDNQDVAASVWGWIFIIVFVIIAIAIVLLIVKNNLDYKDNGTFKI